MIFFILLYKLWFVDLLFSFVELIIIILLIQFFKVGTCVEYSESLKDGKICGISVKPIDKVVDLNDDEEIEEQVWHGTGKN
jgi:hypothetical protein